jgi:hypothetical protein
MDFQAFQIGFWHPFGPHAGESVEQILDRKSEEIKTNGWTLWSFQHRKTLEAWHDEIVSNCPESVFVFCSAGKGSKVPTSNTMDSHSYRLVGENDWRRVQGFRVPHHFQYTLASAFIVHRIFYPLTKCELPTIEWFKDGAWQRRTLPTRPEYLIRRGGHLRMPRIRAVLKLKAPYLAFLRAIDQH